MYNKLTKKNKNSSGKRKKGRTDHSTGAPIFGNSVSSQISEFKYTKSAVQFHQSRYFFILKKFF